MKLCRNRTASFVLFLVMAGLVQPSLGGQEKSPEPLHPAVFLKPGGTAEIVLSAPGSRIGAADRTAYDFEFLDEQGKKADGLKGVKIAADRERMGELWDKYKTRFIAIKFSVAVDAEPGTTLVRVRAKPFGGTPRANASKSSKIQAKRTSTTQSSQGKRSSVFNDFGKTLGKTGLI